MKAGRTDMFYGRNALDKPRALFIRCEAQFDDPSLRQMLPRRPYAVGVTSEDVDPRGAARFTGRIHRNKWKALVCHPRNLHDTVEESQVDGGIRQVD